MKTKVILVLFLISCPFVTGFKYSGSIALCQDGVTALKDKLNQLSMTSSNTYFINHCQSFLSVIEAQGELSNADKNLLTAAYEAFTATDINGNPSELLSYINRQRPFIISWVSPTDGAVSFSWLKLPADWDPSKIYPLYIELHGLWGVAGNPVEYLTYPFIREPSDNFAFEDGYLLSPWGRGNLWYKGISETDIWECISSLEKTVKIDPSRKYLCGHSMGGFGAWYIGSKSVNTWAAIGIHAGALWYDQSVLTDDVFQTFKNMPVYFVVGTSDDLYSLNASAYQNLEAAVNTNIEFRSFPGGHEYLAENVQNMYLWMKNYTNDDWFLGMDVPGQVHSLKESINCIPNPVRDKALIIYNLEEPANVAINLYDSNGKKIMRLAKGYKHAGEHNLEFDTTNLPAGIYSCCMEVKGRNNFTKIIIIE